MLPPLLIPEDDPEYDIKKLTPAELEKVPFDVVRWQCKIKLCKHYTRLRDYGMDPVYYHKSGMKSQKGFTHWVNVEKEFFMCHGHWKAYGYRPIEWIPLKTGPGGGVLWGCDDTGKETIIY